ncbi:lysylphosphatidylglycerol synthase transmembrane domain-containing protein [Parasphaerochaeta coccoides]|uniref:Lysylphosphatidylglycerol synthetase/UPF0104 n=1 Tax=Parasphaerochaeta coccoides (strain ATCC BAA-1237 / DSM 17374 / SPN1) TaxID=760011 RepID=F4GH58_PARC1|nr:lysylphosphatidylglycerol synthase transmembrane domain-containing protein [Parasphaerochaeta coccoides]AEC01533.1 hypothetical protein Spico_0303 [Parasphaerochaeta coccoides DSM 17374]
MKNKLWNWVFIVVSLFAFMGYLVWKEGLTNIRLHVTSMAIGWLWVGILFQWVSHACDAMIIWKLSRDYPNSPSFLTCMRSILVGNMLGHITPMMAGNFPAQIALLTKDGMRAGDSATVLMAKAIAYQGGYACVIILSVLKGWLSGGFGLSSGIWLLIYAGMVVSIFAVLFFVLVLRAQKLISGIVKVVIRFLGKVKIVKNPQRLSERTVEEITRMGENVRGMKTTFSSWVGLIALGFLQVAFTMVFTYAVYRSLRLSGESIIDVGALQSFASLIHAYVPIPGGLGLGDSIFLQIMGTVMGERNVDFAMVVWRLLAFYLPIMYGVVAFGIKKKQKPVPDASAA